MQRSCECPRRNRLDQEGVGAGGARRGFVLGTAGDPDDRDPAARRRQRADALDRLDAADAGQQRQDIEQIRDFVILHYKATDRRDSAFWRHVASMPVPDSLAQKIELFRETGRTFRKNDELFAENSWVQVMMGQGIDPRSWHPIAEKLSDEELARLMTTLREDVTRTVSTLPAHHAYVAQYCGAADPLAA